MDESIEKLRSGETWQEFCDLLKQAGDVVLADDLATTDLERAEGLRYLSRILRAGLASFVEHTGPKHPVFRPMPDQVKLGLDNPDNFYVSASVNGRYSYRIRGTRGNIHYLSFAAQAQNFAARDRISGGAGHLEDNELEIDSEGRFEIIASQQEQPGNWLRMNADTSQILVRQTFLDRNRERPVDIEIRCLDAEGAPAPLDPTRIEGQLKGSALYAIGAARWFADWVRDFPNHAPVNAFHRPDPEQHRVVGGDPNIINLLGLFELGPDEALLVEATPPDCDYWNLQLGNIWAESLDFRFRPVARNAHTTTLRDDGSFRMVIAHENPGDPNWIDTAGHARGTLCLRWVRAASCPMPECRVVKLSELGAG
jgi:hypothetical protein